MGQKKHKLSPPLDGDAEVFFYFEWDILGNPRTKTSAYYIKMSLAGPGGFEFEDIIEKIELREAGSTVKVFLSDEESNGWFAVPGDYTLTCVVDSQGDVSEWDENNNKKTYHFIVTERYYGPHQIDGEIKLLIFYACDEDHRPGNTQGIRARSEDAMHLFKDNFKVETSVICHYGIWDASGTGWDIDEMRKSIRKYPGVNDLLDKKNKFAMGWVRYADHNGIADRDGFHCIGAENVPWYWPNWHERSIAQHEVSHLFNAPDHGIWWPSCIMTYFWAKIGATNWCSSCYEIVNNNIWEGNPP